MRSELTILCNSTPVELLKRDLEGALPENSGIGLDVRRGGGTDRSSVDPTVLVAIVAASGTALASLIKGLLSIATPRQKVVIHGKSGRSIEVPANSSEEELRRYVEVAEELDAEQISLTR